MDGWVVIPNWRKFQHYRNRQPTWIKVYTELNSTDEWLALSMASRGLLVTCWAEYARSRGQLSTEHVRHLYGLGFKYAYLEVLRDAGFIRIVASKPLALVTKPASPEVEVEKKRKHAASNGRKRPVASGRRSDLLDAADRFAAGWNGGSSEAFDYGLDELEQLTGARLGAGDRYRLWEQALKGSHLH